MLGHLWVELSDIDMHFHAEHLRLAREWRQLEVTINFGRPQHEHAHANTEESLAMVREARDHVLEEAQPADCRREATKRREELQASNATLERQVQACKATS